MVDVDASGDSTPEDVDVDLGASAVAVCKPPVGGLYRVGRAVEPMRPSSVDPVVEASAKQGNRFDTSTFGVIYMGTTLEACFGETLARYRPEPSLAELVEYDWR